MRHRLVPALLLLVSMAVLGVASWLTPSARGVGTHEQLGLAPCTFLAATGLPCATCGMTTAFAHAAHGQLLAALYVQPAGALLAVLTAATAIVSAYALVRGLAMGPLIEWLMNRWVVVGLVVVLMAAWIYKILLVRGMN